MLKKIEEEMKTVPVFTQGVLPPEDSPVHAALSWAAFLLCVIDEPLCVVETYLHEDAGELGHLDLVYHADHEVKWEEMQLECDNQRFACFERLFLPKPAYNQGLGLDTLVVRVNFRQEEGRVE